MILTEAELLEAIKEHAQWLTEEGEQAIATYGIENAAHGGRVATKFAWLNGLYQGMRIEQERQAQRDM